jgi:glycosyltransferase involved in cell wall biosynthesis
MPTEEPKMTPLNCPTIAVSVIIPAYNCSTTIAVAIDSVLNQTISDLEVILVDDGSNDTTVDIFRQFMKVDGRLRLMRQANAGPSSARNRGVQAARSEIIAFIDADDAWMPDHLALNLANLNDDPRLGVSFTTCEIVDPCGRLTGDGTRASVNSLKLTEILSSNPTATCSSLVFRGATFRQAGPMRTDMMFAEDQEWLFRVIQSGWQVRGIDRRTVCYRTSPNGLSANLDKMMAGWKVFVEHARHLEPEIVQRHEQAATSHMHFYLARRAIRTGQPARTALRQFKLAVAASPQTAMRNPLYTAALAVSCLVPKLTNRAITTIRTTRHV